MTLTKKLGWVVASALGVGTGLSSHVVSNETRAPLKSLATGVPPSGVAAGNVALASFAARRAQSPNADVNSRELSLAAHSYHLEPLAASAVAIQALRLDKERQWALLELTGKLTRRNTLVNSALIEAAARRRDDRKSFVWISRTMLTNSDAGAVYGKAMAAATARDGAVEALIDVLGPKPRWSERYWQLIIGQPDSYVNAAKLRIALAKAPWKQTAIDATDKDLVRALANAGKFDDARQLASSLHPMRTATVNQLTNGAFSADPTFAPFDWELSTLGNLGAAIDKGNEQLVISAIGGARGSAARQLVRLTPGNYRLSWSLSTGAPLPANAISARIYCAESKAAQVQPFVTPLTVGKRQMNVKIIEGVCRWHWLSIDVALPDDAIGADITIAGLTLTSSP